MSLINQMLRDLEARNASESNTLNAANIYLPSNATRYQTNKRAMNLATLGSGILLGFGSLLIILLTGYQFGLLTLPTATPNTATTPAASAPSIPSAISNSNTIATAEQPVPANTTPTPAMQTTAEPLPLPDYGLGTLTLSAPTDLYVSTLTNNYPSASGKKRKINGRKLNLRPHATVETASSLDIELADAAPERSAAPFAAAAPSAEEQPDLNTRLAQVKTLMQENQLDQASAYVEQSLREMPDNTQLINAQAQLLLQQKQAPEAINVLQKHASKHAQDETYHTLLAAAYQETGASHQAAIAYQQLIKKRPEKAEYWLGLALAQENNGNKAAAEKAYTAALMKKNLPAPVIDYINQRLTELNSQ